MDQDKPVFSGLLLLPPQAKLLMKKTWHQRFCQLYKASKFGIERLEIYDSIDENSITKNTSSRIITLENCVKIAQKHDTAFQLITKTASYEFNTITQQSLKEWLAALQSVAFKDETSRITSIEEDNDLYCSSSDEMFKVRLHSSEATERCGLYPQNYILLLTATAIQIRDNETSKILYTWPYRFIRRYGYRDGKFTFEAGRKCESGEGAFHLEHSNQKAIFRCVASKMKSMKKLLNNETPSTILDCGENQFQAALGMEARSRTPLPPSPTTSSSLQDLESDNSNITTANSLFDSSFEKKLTSIGKVIPTKPPRKFIGGTKPDVNVKHSNYELVDKYDQVEFRNEAWRTLGTDDIKHTENVEDEELEEYVSWGRKMNNSPIEQLNPPKVSQIINVSPSVDDSYDRLNFFGSSGKLNVKNSEYQQVSSSAVVLPPPQSPPSFNDYDEVVPTMESVRIADDSHLGYAMIRKMPKDSIDHQFHNNEPYAVIHKPKRV